MQPLSTLVMTALQPIITILLNYFQPIIETTQQLSVKHVHNFNEPYNKSSEYPVLDFIGLVERHGYTAEEFDLNSSDGYILKLHRISGGPVYPKAHNKPVVYIQHGILLSSDSWVLIGPKTDLAFLLSDAGYDVWIGNVRGNTYSQAHTNKSLPASEFWKFSYHEMATYDIRAFIDFICLTTNQEQITYIGYSMGTTLSYAFLSTFPSYNEKIKAVFSLAPGVYWQSALRPIPALMNRFYWLIDIIVEHYKIIKVFPQTALAAYIGNSYCKDEDTVTQPLCVNVLSTIGLDPKRMNKTAIPDILAHFPSGTSMVTVNHYHQNFLEQTFQAFDYKDAEENSKKYNQVEPPKYDLKHVTAPVHIWYAKNDDIMNSEDVITLYKALPNSKTITEVNYVNFNHFDFLWATDVKELVYDQLIKTMKKVNA